MAVSEVYSRQTNLTEECLPEEIGYCIELLIQVAITIPRGVDFAATCG